MILMRIPAALVTGLLALPAGAHTPLHDSMPADGSVGPAPATFVLNFAHPARVTSLRLTGPEGVARPIRGLAKRPAASHAVPAPTLSPGRYELSFRAAAEDGHIMSGTIQFTVTAPGAAVTAPRPQ
jgi:methionine-rich copper-binding protein CopC